MDKRRHKRISKHLSYILRHHPESIGIKIDKGGWIDVSELLQKVERNNFPITLDELRTVVKENNKQRFSFSNDGRRIRANQGHSIPVDLGYAVVVPLNILYHGTDQRNIESIWINGLTKGDRHHVHLSSDQDTATKVGQRHGRPVIFKVQAKQMHQDGHKFYLSANGIWLTEHVAPKYLKLLQSVKN